MNYSETLNKIFHDTRFQSYQDFDPELLANLEYYQELPEDVKEFCSTPGTEGAEPYFNQVVDFVTRKAIEQRKNEITKALTQKPQTTKRLTTRIKI